MTATPLPRWKFERVIDGIPCVPTIEAEQARADLEAENQRLRKIAWLIGSIFVHGNFKAETHNERELEKLLRENGTFWESLADFDARAALEKQP